MSLTNELGMLEAERDRIKAENETLKIRLAKMAGANAANERTVMYLESRIEKLTEFNTTVKHLLHSILGTKDTIVRQQADLAKAEHTAEPVVPPIVAEAITAPDQIETIKKRIKRIMGSEANGAGAHQ